MYLIGRKRLPHLCAFYKMSKRPFCRQVPVWLGLLYLIACQLLQDAQAGYPRPTAQQQRWLQGEIVALIHFNMATFFRNGDPGCDSSNWDQPNGSRWPTSFQPTALNTTQWMESILALGAKEAVLTAKHGCGFCIWPTQVKLPDGSPYYYNVCLS